MKRLLQIFRVPFNPSVEFASLVNEEHRKNWSFFSFLVIIFLMTMVILLKSLRDPSLHFYSILAVKILSFLFIWISIALVLVLWLNIVFDVPAKLRAIFLIMGFSSLPFICGPIVGIFHFGAAQIMGFLGSFYAFYLMSIGVHVFYKQPITQTAILIFLTYWGAKILVGTFLGF